MMKLKQNLKIIKMELQNITMIKLVLKYVK